jgi:hypothetical protein
MSPSDKRRDARYFARLPIKLIRGKDVTSLQTDDVSFRGAFLRMDSPPALRQLLRVEVTLPEGVKINAHAMVVYRVAAGGNHPPGAGIQFYGLDGRERSLWESFVQKMRDEAPRSSPLHMVPEGAPDPVRRKHERHSVRFEVRLSSLDELKALYSRDISKGGMAVETTMDVALGTEVGLDLVHPQRAETFELTALVRRKIRQPSARGIAVEFTGMDEARREALERFIGPQPPREDVLLVKAGDPKLA